MNFVWKTTLAIAIAAAMTAPVAQAEWYAFGSFEPDTSYDFDWSFTEPPGIGDSKLYFTVITTASYASLSKPVNPNVGVLATQIENPGVEWHEGFLGVWKDCNGDGYIGAAESGLREYPAQLMTAGDDACPLVTGPAAAAWPAGAHNYNGWVSELVPIVNTNTNNIDRRVYRDDDARVWGDFHRPDEKPFHRSCTLRPFARGTLQDTGGFLNYFDCRQPILENFNVLMAAVGDPADLSFPDEDDARTGTLGQVDIGGDESSDNAAFYTTDCSESVRSGDVINETAPPEVATALPAAVHNNEVFMPEPAPAEDPDAVTLAGQLNATLEENPAWDDCDTSNDFGHDMYEPVPGIAFETDFNGVNPNNKLEADWNFNVTTVLRGAPPHSVIGTVNGWNGFAGAPQDFTGIGGTRWSSDSTWLSKTGPRSVRADIESGGASIAPAYWLTFYAHLGATTLGAGFERATDEIGTYGSWHCGLNESGIHNGWNCDASLWYQNPDGSFPPGSTLAFYAKPGWKYHMRDVDCYDGRIGETGAAVEPAFFGEEPCITP